MGRTTHAGTRTREIEYDALPSQAKFHQSSSRFKGFSGPIGSGKSQALCQEAIRLSYVNAGRQGLIGAPTYPMLRDATQAALFEILTRNRLPYEFNKAENFVVMNDTGSKIVFRSVDDFERLRGTNLAWFGVDELTYCPEEAWLRLEGRLRDPKAASLCGFAVWTPKGFDWVYRRFISDPVAGYETILAAPSENRHLLTQIPDFYERLRQSYDARFYEQEVLGAYLNVQAGQAYHQFSREANVVSTQAELGIPLLWALDFNVDPMSSVVVQRQRGKFVVLDEISLHRATTVEACEEFVRRFPQWTDIVIYGDASGSHMQTSGTSDYNMIRSFMATYSRCKYRLAVPKKNPAVRERVALVNSMLCTAAGDRELLIDGRCKELILDLEQVCLQEGSMIIDKGRDAKRTHMSDALGYLLWQETQGRNIAGPQDRRLF